MRLTWVIVFTVFGFSLMAQELNKTVVDQKSQKEVLIGKCDRNGLNSDLFKQYFTEGYANYTPDQSVISQLKKKKKGVKIMIVMGSWCGDSQDQVPAFYKIVDEIGFDESNVELVAVDRTKTAGNYDVSGLNIQRVPTFVFYRNNREIGRIVETPLSTLEKDMMLIFSQE